MKTITYTRTINDVNEKIVMDYDEDESTECIIPKDVTKIGGYAFESSGITSVIIPYGVAEIGSHAFSECYYLEKIIISDSVKKIGQSAFYSCEKLTDIVIPNSVTNIGYRAFEYCDSLTNITISDNLELIKGNAFYKCDNIQNVNVRSYDVYRRLKRQVNEKLKLCATVSIVKNYYNKTGHYTENEIKDLEDFIKENRIELFIYALKNIELYKFMFDEIKGIYSATDIKELLEKVKTEEYSDIRVEATSFIIDYMYKNGLVGKIYQTKDILDGFDDDIDDDLKKGKPKIKS